MRTILSLCLTASLLSACKFKDVKDNSPDETVTVDPDTPVSFAEIHEKILEPSCLGCHSAAGGNQGGVNVETHAAAKSVAGGIRSSTVNSRRMPKGDSLSANEIALLKAWLDQGTPE
jgi:uncharacterized membrane protein